MQCSDVGIKGFHMVSPIYFGLICEILEKVQHDKVEQMKKVAPKWQTQPWYPFFWRCKYKGRYWGQLCQSYCQIFRGEHILYFKWKLKFSGLESYKKSLEMEGISRNFAKFSTQSWVLLQITNRPTVVNCFFPNFKVSKVFFLNFLAVFQDFLVKYLPVFKVLLKNFIRSIRTDLETSEWISISEDSQTKKWVIYYVSILASILTNEVKR